MLGIKEEEHRLATAAQVSMETNQMTPIIKEELRLSIIKKRHASGQEDIKVEFPEPVKHELTPHEKMKRERRREQNRRAAQRCRQKKKLMSSGKQEVFATIINQNNNLQAEVKRLKKEKKKLADIYTDHIKSGCCQQRKFENEAPSLGQCQTDLTTPVTLGNQNQLAQFTHDAPVQLPSFNDTFLEQASPSSLNQEIFQYPPLMPNDVTSARTWSGCSDDVDLAWIFADAIDQTTNDDVFYDNAYFPVKIAAEPEFFDNNPSMDDGIELPVDFQLEVEGLDQNYFDQNLVHPEP